MTRKRSLILAALLAITPLAAARSQEGPPDSFTFAVAGDMIGPYHPFPGPEDQGFAAVAALLKGADIAYANQEGSVFDLAAFSGWPAAAMGGKVEAVLTRAARPLGVST